VADGELADGELADGELADGELADGELADGELADGELADGELGNVNWETPTDPNGPTMTEPEAGPSFDLVAAALRADTTDVATYARVFTESLGEALPPGVVTVERDRTMADRMRGRPGEVQRVTVRLGEQVMSLGVRRGQPIAEICREVRGVILSRQQVQLDQWADALAKALVAHASDNARAAQALRRLVTGS